MKKRDKKYRPKPCVLPLGMRKAIEFEMPGYQASVIWPISISTIY